MHNQIINKKKVLEYIIMALKQKYNSLCPPAKLYLVMSGISVLLLFIQNLRKPNHYTVGSYQIPLNHHNVWFFIVKVLAVTFWTWALNKFCSKGYTGVAWFLVLIPFILFFVAIGFVVVTGMKGGGSSTGPQITNYQPVYMRQPPPTQVVLGSGHTASCQCPRCVNNLVNGTAPSQPVALPPTPPTLYGRQGPIYPQQSPPYVSAPDTSSQHEFLHDGV